MVFRPRRRAKPVYRGVGFSITLEPAPGPPDFLASVGGFVAPPEPATARLEVDGTITVATAQVSSGQGHETTFAQIAADELGVDPAVVNVQRADTDAIPFSLYGTGGSRAANRAGGAVRAASAALRRRILDVGATLMEASAEDLAIAGGSVIVRGTPARSVSLADVAGAGWHGAALLPDEPTKLEAAATSTTPGPGWSQAVHAAVVRVDTETGDVEIERYVAVEDCGAVINPDIVEGQVQGGVAQGIAGVLFESLRYDPDAQPVTSSLADYCVPSSVELPPIEVSHVPAAAAVSAPRGVGEGGAIAAPAAVLNAIEDALRPFRFVATSAHIEPGVIVQATEGEPDGR